MHFALGSIHIFYSNQNPDTNPVEGGNIRRTKAFSLAFSHLGSDKLQCSQEFFGRANLPEFALN